MKARFQCSQAAWRRLLTSAGLFAFTLGIAAGAHAGGVALGATRVIYPQGEKQVSLPLTNSSENNDFLIQSWVANPDGAKSQDFVITPPLFVIHPKKENTLRIMYVGPGLPEDRESVFYLNSKAIPSVDKSKLASNTLQIATQSVIKLFVRPKHLPTPSVNAPKTLTCQQGGGKVTVNNPSPYYVSLVQFYAGGTRLPNSMVAPKSSLTVAVPGGQGGKVSFQTVNDFGANTPTQFCSG
ncbi:fimbria/pilus periplasmic chaperone [Pluralibacter sp.]|uniref:fimbria/pilus periplasmic chaperone n=1 Tax=Pluralibacter sp. TaxID=1920032 RepID=UPI0025DEE61C|nr:fimbria/pilus periplasmic chaperone [Pluralibacter sp.]MBV8044833.1 fimbria/pilus periplasmic chaperone [Pluralibacter sp.]